MSIRYGVIGTGAIGGFYGGKLAHSGCDVHFLFLSDFQHVQENGLRVDSVKGDFHLQQVACYSSVQEMPVCDVVLVGLKTINNHLLPELLRPIVHKDSLVILIQNGLGIEAELAHEMPDIHIAGGMAFICSNKTGPGHISHLDFGRIEMGLFTPGGTELLQQCCSDFEKAGVPVIIADNLGMARWKKLIWNIPFNGLTVVLNTTTDKIMKQNPTKDLAYEMMQEVIEAAHTCGFEIDRGIADQMITMTEGMTPYAPSMKLDFDNNRPMEIQSIYTNPVQTAQKAGYEMKKVAMLEQQLRFISER
ncbi:putative 2-dehydropantoate 2-reductase [Prolixibacteraceae bacterium Z1-6]|uniref:2-dehydropantoate 2-reductase n=1 Tax=Draconibacterium aestuarii TaxID=2998507 RepID=A0A9X3F2U3_9BACT|nr:putative 2-dehydropantoate 2-reductase [Prolixibacteraceae bacterium Z1-6]